MSIWLSDLMNPQSIAIDVANWPIFVASGNYTVDYNGATNVIPLAGVQRKFDLVGPSFVDAETGVTNLITLQGNGQTIAGTNITNSGITGRVFKDMGRVMLGVLTGDPPSGGSTCRAQISSYQIPTRTRTLIDLIFQFGDNVSTPTDRRWVNAAVGSRPALIFQMKQQDAANPAFSLVCDTDPNDSTKLILKINRRAGTDSTVHIEYTFFGLSPYVPYRILIDAVWDEREIVDGGMGWWKVYGKIGNRWQKVTQRVGPTLTGGATPPTYMPQMFLDNYMYGESTGGATNRFIVYHRARLHVDPKF